MAAEERAAAALEAEAEVAVSTASEMVDATEATTAAQPDSAACAVVVAASEAPSAVVSASTRYG